MKSPHFLFNTVKALAVSAVTIATSSPVQAQQQWWFDVEIIVFKRLQEAEALTENFGKWQAIDTTNANDLLTPYLYPDVSQLRQNLPQCEPEKEVLPTIDSLTQALEEYESAKEALSLYEVTTETDAQAFDSDSNLAEPSSVNETETTAASATDDLFHILEQQQESIERANDSNEALEGTFSFFNEEEIASAFEQLILPADHNIAWLEIPSLTTVACQFPQELRYFKDIIFPFELKPKQVDATPRYVDPPYKRYNGQAYLLPRYDFQLSTMARDLNRQRGVRIMSHMLWRQEVVFGRSKAPSYRLLAGKNYGNDYQPNGTKRISKDHLLTPIASDANHENFGNDTRSPDDELLRKISAIIEDIQPPKAIEQALSESEAAIALTKTPNTIVGEEDRPSSFPAVWELDGLFKIYLQRLGQTPYLHIDSELNFRQPGKFQTADNTNSVNADWREDSGNTDEFLHSYQFKQLRRIISKQIHYFDHPAFGLIIQLRRYNPPEEADS